MPERLNKELTVVQWFEEISSGLEFRRRYGLEDEWSNLEALFYNVHQSQAHEGPNILLSTGDALMSSLNVPKPFIAIKAERAEAVDNQGILEAIDNNLLKVLMMTEEFELASLHAYLWGVGILKVGYDSEYGYDPSLDLPDLDGITMSQLDKKGRRIEFGGARPGMPWVSAVLPHDIVVPWGTRDFKTARWIAHRVIRHVDEIRADEKYVTVRELRPTLSMRDVVRSYQNTMKEYRFGTDQSLPRTGEHNKGMPEFVELWEIHDRRTEKIFTVASDHQKFLRNDIDYLQVGGLPFVGFNFVPRSRNFWVTPDAYYLQKPQAEASDIALQGTKLRRSSIPKIIANEDAFDEGELDKLLTSDVRAVIKARGGQNLRESLQLIQGQSFDVGLSSEMERVRRDAREAIGLSRNQAGEFETTGRRTATEAGIVDRSARFRMGRRSATLGRSYEQVFYKINQIIFSYWKTPRVVELVNDSGAATWERFVGSDLKGDYSYSVDFTEEGTSTPGQRESEALQLYMALSQDPSIDPIELRRFLVRSFRDQGFKRLFPQGVENAALPPQVPGMQGGQGNLPVAQRGGGGVGMPGMQG